MSAIREAHCTCTLPARSPRAVGLDWCATCKRPMTGAFCEDALRRQVRTLTVQLQAATAELRWLRMVLAADDGEDDGEHELPEIAVTP